MRTIFFLAALLSAGCSSEPLIDAAIVSRVTPNYTPQRSDAIAIVVPDTASAEDQALIALLIDELPRDGFNIVDKPEFARWILQAGYVVAVQPTNTVEPESTDAPPAATDDRKADIRLSLYSVTEYINGNAVAIWTATAYDPSEQVRQHPQNLLRQLMKNFGGDFDGGSRTTDPDDAASRVH